MRKVLIAMIAVCAALAVMVVTPDSAQAAEKKIPKKYALWTRAHCQSGKRVWNYQFFKKPKGPHVLVYRTDGRICAYTVDGMKGKHRLEAAMTKEAGNYYTAYDDGVYSEYAGAVAAPKGACIWSQGMIVLDGRPYWSRLVHRCA
ncbi:hypothetical protein [Nocardioides sp. KR10-350]|uniref:hypothetical protein n=1 Tax=Nocardioides cheoyonin TaxID=3156615 RepID=UPI0032B4B63A